MKTESAGSMYEVFNPSGARVLFSPDGCRYPRVIERQLLAAGYRITINGKPMKQ